MFHENRDISNHHGTFDTHFFLISPFFYLYLFVSKSVSSNYDKREYFLHSFSDHVKMCCDSSTWAILLLFSKNGSVFRAALLNSMKYRDHFLISSQLSYFILHFTVVEPYKTTVSGLLLKYRNCISVLSISKKHILTTKKILQKITTFSPPDEQSNWLSF